MSLSRQEILLLLFALVVGGIVDASLRRQLRLEEEAAHDRAAAETAAAAWAVHGAMVRLEAESISAEGTSLARWRQAVPRGRSLEGSTGVAFRRRTAEDLREAARSDRTTRSGLPVAVLAGLALGDETVLKRVRTRFLRGEIPVAPDDLEGLAELLEIAPGPGLDALGERLERLPQQVPDYPDFARRVDGQKLQGFSRLERDVVHYEVALSEVLARAGIDGAVLDPEGLPVPGLEDVRVAVQPEIRGARHLRAARLLVAAFLALAVLAVFRLIRTAAREREIAERERALLAAVSHDLRTPLASMRLFGESLVEGVGDPKDYGRLISDEAQRLEETFERILSATRTREAPRFEDVDPTELVRRARAGVESTAERHGVVVEGDDRPGLPAAVWDREGVHSALLNLLDNAIRHGGSGGRVELRAAAEGRRIRFSVRDRGRGIRSADLTRVFGRFARADSTANGSGLGLYLVEQTAKAHGGRVEIETPPEGGCIVHLLLPLDAEDRRNGPTATAETPAKDDP